MKLDRFLFVLFVLIWIVAGVTLAIPERSAGHGFDHPKYNDMHQGGSGTARHEGMLVCGWMFGVLEIVAFVSILSFGVRRRGKLGRIGWAFAIGGLMYVVVFSLMLLAYHDSLQQAEPSFLGPFPTSTALMIFGLWPVPLYFVVLYVVAFNRWILTAEDLDKFQKLVDERRQENID